MWEFHIKAQLHENVGVRNRSFHINSTHTFMQAWHECEHIYTRVCVCACVCACVRACVRVWRIRGMLCMLGGNVYMNTRTSTNKGKTYDVVLSFSRARYVVCTNVCIGLCAWRICKLVAEIVVKLAVQRAMPMRKYLHTAWQMPIQTYIQHREGNRVCVRDHILVLVALSHKFLYAKSYVCISA